MATVRIPSSCADRKTRIAISPRLATSSFEMGLRSDASSAAIVRAISVRRGYGWTRFSMYESYAVRKNGWLSTALEKVRVPEPEERLRPDRGVYASCCLFAQADIVGQCFAKQLS